MQRVKSKQSQRLETLEKAPTGIVGLDEVTGGGLPKGRPTLVCGSAGCGKTLFSMEFLVRGITEFGEPGVFMSFEESSGELTQNVASLGFDLNNLVARKKLVLDHVYIERSEIAETGDYDLEGLFIRLGHAIKTIGAKRVVLDTIEALFSGIPNHAILRAEIRRLFRWLKSQGVTAVITGERGDGTLTRCGLEEYVADCVILLDHRVIEQISTRRLRIVKYRGTWHGTNEYPFLIDAAGFTVLPISSLGLNHRVSKDRVPTGIRELDSMLGGKGFYVGSSILISGTAGTGKSTIANYFADSTCRRGARCLYLAFEESQDQIIRNMRSIGLDMAQWVQKGLLQFHNVRPTSVGLEMHLVLIQKMIDTFNPEVVIMDPITNFLAVGTHNDVKEMLMRTIDLMKMRQITALFTSLTSGTQMIEQTEVGISSLMDTWLLVRDLEANGERNRAIYVLKSRGMGHSNQVREFHITNKGVELREVYLEDGGVLMGSARTAQEAKEKLILADRNREILRKERELERKRRAIAIQIAALRDEDEATREEIDNLLKQNREHDEMIISNRENMARMRGAETVGTNGINGKQQTRRHA